jgi:hypothetical protein
MHPHRVRLSWSLPVLLLGTPALAVAADGGQGDTLLRVMVTAFLLLLLLVVFTIIFILNRHFFRACKDSENLELYARLPFGVPEGTIRSTLALVIVLVSLGFVALSMLAGGDGKLPEVLVGILGTVLGFYFGSRTSAEGGGRQALQQVAAADRQRDQAVDEARKTRLGGLLEKARVGVGAARVLTKVLPQEMADKVNRIVNVVDKGLHTADQLASGGQTQEALAEVGKAVSVLDRDHPIREVLSRAASSFAQVLGPVVPPLAIAGVVVAVGAKLAGAAYDRWVARVLNAPYTPELFPPTVIDASVAMSMVRSSPVFRRAFADEMQQGNLQFIRQLVHEALSEDADDILWAREEVASRFEDKVELERGLDEIQRAAMTAEVSKDVDPELVANVGGMDKFLAAVDKLNTDEAAQRDLDTIVLMADELKRQGQAVEPMFEEAMASLAPEEST